MIPSYSRLAAVLIVVGTALAPGAVHSQTGGATAPKVFLASRVITMDTTVSEATAIAVGPDGYILAVGDSATVTNAVRGTPVYERRFRNQVILPGFVEAHTHLQAYGLTAHLPYLGYFDRPGPGGASIPGFRSREAMLARLRTLVGTHRSHSVPFTASGPDPIYFGGQRLTRAALDSVSATVPIMLQMGSGHIVVVNTPMLRLIQQDPGWSAIANTPAVIRKDGQITGELDEMAAVELAFSVLRRHRPRLFGADTLALAIRDGAQMMQRAGITTASEMLFGAPGRDAEEAARSLYAAQIAAGGVPVRVSLSYDAMSLRANHGAARAPEVIRTRQKKDTERLWTGPMKFILDGSIQGYTAEVGPPGYYNAPGTNPMWNVDPDSLYALLRPFWGAGIRSTVHANGDLATSRVIAALRRLTADSAWADHRTTLQHNQLSTRTDYEALRAVGGTVNLFTNHLYYYGDQHAAYTVGLARARTMNDAGLADGLGIPFSLHSDAPVTPAAPLFAAWTAVNRRTASGQVLDEGNAAIRVERALRAVTWGGAYLLGMEKCIGSIAPGKLADFVVLQRDPLEVPAMELKNVAVVNTVVGGHVHGDHYPLEQWARDIQRAPLSCPAAR